MNVSHRRKETYSLLDKTKVPSFEHVRLAFEALAHFHGAWTKVLRSKAKLPGLTFTQKDLERNFKLAANPLAFKLIAGTRNMTTITPVLTLRLRTLYT